MMRRILGICTAVVALAMLAATFSGCNTMRGLGTDIEKGGKAIEKAASK